MLLVTASLVFMAGAGCTQSTSTKTNETVNESGDTVVADNTNMEQGNETADTETVENTNADVGDTNIDIVDDTVIDTSDWLTYNNEEYGFSLKYPSNYSFSESHQGVNFQNAEPSSTVASQENIKFYVQSYSEAPDKEGEAYALLSTKAELSALKDTMIQDSDKTVNGIPLDIYYSYDVPGEAFYRGANFFVNQDYIMVSMVVMPMDIEYPNHSFNSETREWSGNIVQQLNESQLISKNDQMRINIFDTMVSTVQQL